MNLKPFGQYQWERNKTLQCTKYNSICFCCLKTSCYTKLRETWLLIKYLNSWLFECSSIFSCLPNLVTIYTCKTMLNHSSMKTSIKSELLIVVFQKVSTKEGFLDWTTKIYIYSTPLDIPIDHFTVVSLVTWPWIVSEAGVDLVLIETSLLFICKSCCSYAN